ncbi:2-succinylbenzoate--CoA ligase [Aplysia californica]|uniref:2-succinylbenzoate--CoA ligase n=1 Tax=Aplysia californica TaxID=6500 RepID=A0ABM1W4U3_APLCA|nr:2-succinylbenzoate--CoA ligase [Aplysia californica]
MGANNSSLHHLRTIPQRLQYFSENCPDNEMFVFYTSKERTAFTSKQVYDLASRFAWWLHQQGFQRYDVIANTLPNSPERLITDLGIMFAGCTALNGQILLADGEDFFSSAVTSRCKAVIVCPRENEPAWRLLKSDVTGSISGLFADMSCSRSQDLTSAILVSRGKDNPGCAVLEELTSGSGDTYVEDVDPDDVFMIFTTSGSTGYSKMVPRTHRWIFDSCDSFEEASSFSELRNHENDAAFNDRPLGWLGGYPTSSFAQADKRVLLDTLYRSRETSAARAAVTWNAILKERCKLATILPLDFYEVSNYVKSQGGSRFKLDTLGIGGQPVRKDQIADMLELFEKVVVTYGATEFGLVSASTLTEANVEDFFSGKPLDENNVRVVNKDQQNCKTKEVGTIHVRGSGVFTGYFNKLEETDKNTAKAFTTDGWFNTEDNGFFDEQGNLYVLGREKDIIMYGSFVVYPGWLERKMVAHPDVADVVVVPVSDPVLFHNICACVKPAKEKTLDVENLRDFCEKMFLSSSEDEATPIPKYFMILEEFPMTSTGKPHKQLMKKMAEERFGQTVK